MTKLSRTDKMIYALPYPKAYKLKIINIFRMFPGDPTGSPDDFFLSNYLNILRFL